MKLDAEEGPSAGWVRAEVSQAPGPLAYIVVEDLATTLAEVEAAGGRVLVPKLPFAGGGEIALFADPDGNVVAIWMRKDHRQAAAPPAGKVAAASGTTGAGGSGGRRSRPQKKPAKPSTDRRAGTPPRSADAAEPDAQT